MRRGMLVLAAAAAFGLGAPAASAAPTEITFGGISFTPNDVTVNFVPGENTFEWNRDEPVAKTFHSVTSTGGNFGVGPSSFTDFDLRASAGTYPYYCVNHGSGGSGPMAGVVAVRPIVTGADNDSYDVVWADGGTQTGSTFEARWKKDGQDKWKRWSSFESNGRTFGQQDKPTDVKQNKTYLLQIRSRFPGTSKWSPKLTLTQPS